MKATYRYWDKRKQFWRHAKIEATTVEDVEEFLTHTTVDFEKVYIDGKLYNYQMKGGKNV